MYKERTQYIDNKGLIKFDDGWKFAIGPIIGAEKPNFDHSSWQDIDLPHDFSIDQAYSKAGEAQSAYKLGGIGWYRKFFRIEDIKSTFIYFDGIYSDAYIYINGKFIGEHHYGYTPFIIDISPYLYEDRENLLAIRVESHIPNSRWYSEYGTDDKREKVKGYEIEKRDSSIVYKFDHLLATYVKIVGKNLEDEKIKILSLKYISEISPSLDIEKIIINGKDCLCEDYIEFDGQIESIDVLARDNISYNFIKESRKLILVSEDNKNIRSLTIKSL